MREIETCVHGVTRVAVEASRFLNYFVLKLLEAKEEVPELNQTFLYGVVFTTMSGAKHPSTIEKLGNALLSYERLRPSDMERFDSRHLNQMLNYACADYLTACKNHVVLNISARVSKAFKYFFDALPPPLPHQKFCAEDRNKVRRYFMRFFAASLYIAAIFFRKDGIIPSAAGVFQPPSTDFTFQCR